MYSATVIDSDLDRDILFLSEVTKHILSLVGWKISSDVSINKSIKFKTLSEMQKDSLSSI